MCIRDVMEHLFWKIFCENKMEDDFSNFFFFFFSYSVFNNRNYNRGYIKLPRIISLKRLVSFE